jgi:hypothetical protein
MSSASLVAVSLTVGVAIGRILGASATDMTYVLEHDDSSSSPFASGSERGHERGASVAL